jgi:hypothetical protein
LSAGVERLAPESGIVGEHVRSDRKGTPPRIRRWIS